MRQISHANNKMMRIFFRSLSIVLLLYITACTSDDTCRKNKFVNIRIQFYKYTLDTTSNNYKLGTWSVDSLTAKGIGIDSVIYKNTKSINIINLQLQKQANSSKFLVTTNNINDTLTIVHTNKDYYLSLECGCIKTHYIDSVHITKHSVDSVKIINPDVNTSNATNLRIFN